MYQRYNSHRPDIMPELKIAWTSANTAEQKEEFQILPDHIQQLRNGLLAQLVQLTEMPFGDIDEQ